MAGAEGRRAAGTEGPLGSPAFPAAGPLPTPLPLLLAADSVVRRLGGWTLYGIRRGLHGPGLALRRNQRPKSVPGPAEEPQKAAASASVSKPQSGKAGAEPGGSEDTHPGGEEAP